nr:hypothetical protein [Actinomycetota bacterium]NIS33091.1 hypothetical protein [Actinomycetota bacterium]NIT96630.1 hypothetical protein [Actinomycetota bacterium]NIU20325.1 hypothetical protein [Actinomycetota bacterium]NIU68018.1 hypothetical protein [Actinomycetota bacterium]
MRRAVRIAGFTLVWLGLFLFGFVGYQLWVTDLLNDRVQAEAREQLVADLVDRRAELAAPIVVTTPPAPVDDADAGREPEEEPVVLRPEPL